MVYMTPASGTPIHLRQLADGRVLIGERNQDFATENPTQGHASNLLRQAARYFPALREVEIDHFNVEWRPMPGDRMPSARLRFISPSRRSRPQRRSSRARNSIPSYRPRAAIISERQVLHLTLCGSLSVPKATTQSEPSSTSHVPKLTYETREKVTIGKITHSYR